MTSHSFAKPIVNTLEKSFRSISRYYYKWKIKINEDKSKSIFFTRRRARRFIPNCRLRLNNHEITWSNAIKYLGVELDKTLTFGEHVKFTKLKVLKYIRILYPFINRKSKLNFNNKLLLFKNIFLPILLYASPVWGKCANTHLNTLQTTQNKILKLIMNKPFYYKTSKLLPETNSRSIKNIINTRTNTFKTKCNHSDNPLILNMFN